MTDKPTKKRLYYQIGVNPYIKNKKPISTSSSSSPPIHPQHVSQQQGLHTSKDGSVSWQLQDLPLVAKNEVSNRDAHPSGVDGGILNSQKTISMNVNSVNTNNLYQQNQNYLSEDGRNASGNRIENGKLSHGSKTKTDRSQMTFCSSRSTNASSKPAQSKVNSVSVNHRQVATSPPPSIQPLVKPRNPYLVRKQQSHHCRSVQEPPTMPPNSVCYDTTGESCKKEAPAKHHQLTPINPQIIDSYSNGQSKNYPKAIEESNQGQHSEGNRILPKGKSKIVNPYKKKQNQQHVVGRTNTTSQEIRMGQKSTSFSQRQHCQQNAASSVQQGKVDHVEPSNITQQLVPQKSINICSSSSVPQGGQHLIQGQDRKHAIEIDQSDGHSMKQSHPRLNQPENRQLGLSNNSPLKGNHHQSLSQGRNEEFSMSSLQNIHHDQHQHASFKNNISQRNVDGSARLGTNANSHHIRNCLSQTVPTQHTEQRESSSSYSKMNQNDNRNTNVNIKSNLSVGLNTKMKEQQQQQQRHMHGIQMKNDWNDISPNQNTMIQNPINTSNISQPQQQKDTSSSRQENSSIPSLPKELEYDEEKTKFVNDEHRLRLIEEADMNGTLKNGWKLLNHQKQGVLRGLQMRRLILAYDMGLGKTLIGCVWGKAFQRAIPNVKIYIICPVSLKDDWYRTAREATGLKCVEVQKKKKNKGTEKASKKKHDLYYTEISSWAKVPKVPENVENYVVICDEAHNMQNMETTKTKETLKLVLSKRCIGTLLLTGTPMKNGKPSNLFPLLKATRHPFGDDKMQYELYFCNGQQKRYGPGGKIVWDASGSSNLELLHHHISSHVFHKTKEDCLKDLKPKTRVYRAVPVSSKYEIQYNNAMQELANCQSILDKQDTDISHDAILGAFTRVRQVAANSKVDATVALAKDLLEKEPAIVIFSFFVSIAKEVHKKLGESGWTGELLVGETPPAKRQSMVDNFQSGVSAVFVATFGAGGVGITLTAAKTIIFLDRPWTPGDALQAEDRVRRIGQTEAVTSIWMRSFEVDKQIDNLIEHKEKNSNTVVDGKSTKSQDGNKAADAPKISLRHLVKSIVTQNQK